MSAENSLSNYVPNSEEATILKLAKDGKYAEMFKVIDAVIEADRVASCDNCDAPRRGEGRIPWEDLD